MTKNQSVLLFPEHSVDSPLSAPKIWGTPIVVNND